MFSQLVNLINKEETVQERHKDTIRITNFARSGAAFAIAEGLGKTVFINRHTAETTGVEVGHRYGAILVHNRALDTWDASSEFARPADLFAIFIDASGVEDEEASEDKHSGGHQADEAQPEPLVVKEIDPVHDAIVEYMKNAKVASAADVARAIGTDVPCAFSRLRAMHANGDLHTITVAGHGNKRASFVYWCRKSRDAKDVILRGLAADD